MGLLRARIGPLALVPVLALCAAAALPAQARVSGQGADPGFSGILPIGAGQSVVVTQGNNQGDHVGNQRYAFDFADGQRNFLITAAQAGTVTGLNDTSSIQCSGLDWESAPVSQPLPGCWAHANFVLIKDDDGVTATLYMHLLQGSACPPQHCVKIGDLVAQGQPLARAGTTGWSTGIHLHFQAETIPTPRQDPYTGWWFTTSVPAHFADPEVTAQDGDGVPKAGQTFQLGPVPATGSPAPAVDWRNTKYTTDCAGIATKPYGGTGGRAFTVTVRNGLGSYVTGSPTSQGYSHYDVQVFNVAQGDLLGGSSGQAAVLLYCSPQPSNYYVTEVQVFAVGQHRVGIPLTLPDLVPNGLYNLPFFDGHPFTISGGQLITGAAYYGPNDCHACGPSINDVLTWQWNGHDFTLKKAIRLSGRPPPL